MAQVTKLELTQRLDAANKEIVALRHRVSVLEGEIALRAQPVVAVPGQRGRVIIERHGQRTVKRWIA